MLKSFAYHGATVSDLDRSLAFYRDLLHMKVEKTYEVAGKAFEEATGLTGVRARVAVLSSTDYLGDHRLKLMQVLSAQGKQRFEVSLCDVGASHLGFRLKDVQGAYEELRAKGVEFVAPPVHPIPERPTDTFTYLRDPDGMIVELACIPHHHAHVVSDLDRALVFYRDVLGMKLDCILDIKGPRIAEGTGLVGAHIMSGHTLLDDDEYVELHDYLHPLGKKQTEMRLCDVGCTHLGFEVVDVQRTYEALLAKGTKFISRPVHLDEESPDSRMVYALDPDSYPIELRSVGFAP